MHIPLTCSISRKSSKKKSTAISSGNYGIVIYFGTAVLCDIIFCIIFENAHKSRFFPQKSARYAPSPMKNGYEWRGYFLYTCLKRQYQQQPHQQKFVSLIAMPQLPHFCLVSDMEKIRLLWCFQLRNFGLLIINLPPLSLRNWMLTRLGISLGSATFESDIRQSNNSKRATQCNPTFDLIWNPLSPDRW